MYFSPILRALCVTSTTTSSSIGVELTSNVTSRPRKSPFPMISVKEAQEIVLKHCKSFHQIPGMYFDFTSFYFILFQFSCEYFDFTSFFGFFFYRNYKFYGQFEQNLGRRCCCSWSAASFSCFNKGFVYIFQLIVCKKTHLTLVFVL